jgi:hypothetical protein
MRCLTRMGLGLVGLALIVPTAAWADPPDADPSEASIPREKLSKKKKPAPRSVFHKARLCAYCQWEDLRKKGVNVPPPPALPQNPGLSASGKPCGRCGATVVAMGPANGMSRANVVVAGEAPTPAMAMPAPGGMASASNCVQCVASNEAPGYAVSGGDAGYQVAGGNDPMPIGTVEGRYASPNPAVAMGGMGMGMNNGMPMPGGRPGPGGAPGAPGSLDPSVMPSSYGGAGGGGAAYLPDDHRRPHILAHLFGLDALGAHYRRDRDRAEREDHAAISYQPQAGPVTELPASMVYGGR